ncbi:serine/threonine protein kinase [Myxococcota bacterium]
MQLPERFGDYLLLEHINTGGMAEVFKAVAYGIEGFEKIIAIKRVLQHLAEDDTFFKAFVDEARIAVELTHRHIIQIFELGQTDGQCYIAMEYLHGRDLRQLLADLRAQTERLPFAHSAFVAMCVCSALDHAHKKRTSSGDPLNIVHRDVTPHNILIGFDGDVKVTDFGIAKTAMRLTTKTQDGLVKGKLPYLSPEQVRGLELDHRSDLFGVGLVLYEMVTGCRQFTASRSHDILQQIREGDITWPSKVAPDVPPRLEAIVLRALSPNRDRRYACADEMLEDLRQFLRQQDAVVSEREIAAFMDRTYGDVRAAEARQTEQLLTLQPLEVLVADNALELDGSGTTNRPSEETTVILARNPMTAGSMDTSTTIEVAPHRDTVETPFDPIAHRAMPASTQSHHSRRWLIPRTRQARLGVLGAGVSVLLILIGVLLATGDEKAHRQASLATLVLTSEPNGADVRVDGDRHRCVSPTSIPLAPR